MIASYSVSVIANSDSYLIAEVNIPHRIEIICINS